MGPIGAIPACEELQRQAAVNALERARRLAEALAQAAGLKIKGVDKISTGVRIIAPRGAGETYLMAKAASPATHPHRSGGGRDPGPRPGGISGKSLTSEFSPAFLYKG